jgi:hypothetical protein
VSSFGRNDEFWGGEWRRTGNRKSNSRFLRCAAHDDAVSSFGRNDGFLALNGSLVVSFLPLNGSLVLSFLVLNGSLVLSFLVLNGFFVLNDSLVLNGSLVLRRELGRTVFGVKVSGLVRGRCRDDGRR